MFFYLLRPFVDGVSYLRHVLKSMGLQFGSFVFDGSKV
jgi:hypothetical protein